MKTKKFTLENIWNGTITTKGGKLKLNEPYLTWWRACLVLPAITAFLFIFVKAMTYITDFVNYVIY